MAQLPLTYVAWTLPPAGHPDLPALRILNRILGSGENSRLYRGLVVDGGTATRAFGQVEARFGPGLFLLGALSGPGVDRASTEAGLQREVRRLVRDGPTREEVEGAVNQLRAARAGQLLTVAGRAAAIQEATVVRGDPSAVRAEMRELSEASVNEVHDVARRWLTDANRTVVVARPVERDR